MISDAEHPSGSDPFKGMLRTLLLMDWESPGNPMRLSDGLSPADLAGVDFFHNSRLLLQALEEDDGAASTATGNLTRAFVDRMYDRMALPEPYRKSIFSCCKVRNELDIWPLHLARIVCECAGLIGRRKKRFHVTKAARALLPEDQSGTLYRRLFIAHFRKFDLHYNFHLREAPELQQSMAAILWRLDQVAQDWVPMLGLAPKILLPGVLGGLHRAMTNQYDTEEWILSGYVIHPLEQFGLLERKEKKDKSLRIGTDTIRVTPLWRKFISFAGNGSSRSN